MGRLNVTDRMRVIGAEHKATHALLNDVLALLRDLGHNVPKAAKTLMGTPRTPLGDKTFHYIPNAIKKGIVMQLKTGFNFPENLIKLELSVDGIPVFKSPPTGFWPILCRVIGTNDIYPFLCGAFSGPSKPKSVDDFLAPVIADVQSLQETGIDFNGRHFDVQLLRVICDTPARSFVKCTKGHTGY